MIGMDLIFQQNNRVKEYGRKNHNYSPTAKRRGVKYSKFTKGKFLAWDGEGLDLAENKQVYALLANSNRDYIINTEGLSSEDCLDFLTSNMYPDDYIHVVFGGSYDVTMMLRDLDEETLRLIHKGDKPVRWKEYQLEYRPRKSFTVRRYKMEQRNGRWYRCYDAKKGTYIFEKCVTLWDVFGFFGKKFVSVLREWTKDTIYEEKYKQVILDIEAGKARRGSFKADEMKEFVIPYCLDECEALRDIMKILQGYLTEADLVLARWDGAGAIAAAALKKFGVKKHIRTGIKLDEEPYPEEVITAAEYAYFGGWIEAYLFGHIDCPIYHYDLRSAYPSATVDLPSMTMGHWEELEFGNWLPLSEAMSIIETLPSYWVGHIEWKNGPHYGPCPFSWRSKKGNVTRPIRGRGWQWSPEILMAYKVFPKVKIYVDTIYYFVPDKDNIKPFTFVRDGYNLRRKLKEMGKGVEKVYKLYLNSIYGKLAQSLGYNKERGIKPPYHTLVYAGLITSETRAKIMEAVMQHPQAIISVATDGIYSLVPLDLDIGEDLGQWEFTKHESMTIVQPGFYWYVTDGKESHYYRGFNEDCIKRQEVIEAYKEGRHAINVEVTRFITIGGAVGLNDFGEMCKWRTRGRKLDISMQRSSKRIWLGRTLPGNENIRVTRNKIFDPEIFKAQPELLDSRKYEFEWDEKVFFDGQSAKEIIEEMFHMELCTDE